MQTTELLPAGTTAAESDPTTLEDGETVTIILIGKGKVLLVSVSDADEEQAEEQLTSSKSRSYQVAGPYRFKLSRQATASPIGVRMFRT
jgi:hypothetical protein